METFFLFRLQEEMTYNPPGGGGTWSGKGYQLRSDHCGAVAVTARDG